MEASIATRGVNLGGWFILEKWMTPMVFDGLTVDDSIELLQTHDGRIRYMEHIQTFIKDSDIEFLAQSHVRLLRVPIAWWMATNDYDDVAATCMERLDWLFQLAEKHNLRILLDYHGARGSQNGKDHSGKSGAVEWKKYKSEHLMYLTDITRRYADSPALWGVELLNEPVVKENFWALYTYYRIAKKQLKSIIPTTVKVIIHDGFIPILFTNITPWRSKTVLDMHLYEITVKEDESIQQYFDRRDAIYKRRIKFYKHFQPVIIGEWSGVVPEQFLNNISAAERAKIIHENIVRQLKLYNGADAWMFWSFKAEDQSMWNFQSLLKRDKELL